MIPAWLWLQCMLVLSHETPCWIDGTQLHLTPGATLTNTSFAKCNTLPVSNAAKAKVTSLILGTPYPGSPPTPPGLPCNKKVTYLKHINEDAFSSLVGFHGIESLYLGCNSLREVPAVWAASNAHPFTGLPGLTALHLSNNQLQALRSKQFSQLTRLTKLYLGFNEISSISEGAFDGLHQLDVLDVNSNFIMALNSQQLIGIEQITTLNLYNNEIQSIQNHTFSNLTQLKYLNLDGNWDLRSLRLRLQTMIL